MEEFKNLSKSINGRSIRDGEEYEVMAEIGRIISSSAEISEVYAQFGQAVNKHLPFDRISVTTADVSLGIGRTAYAWGTVITGRIPGDVFPLDGTTTKTVIDQRCPVVHGASGVVEAAVDWKLSERQLQGGMKSFIAVPLQSKNERIGILQIHSKKSEFTMINMFGYSATSPPKSRVPLQSRNYIQR